MAKAEWEAQEPKMTGRELARIVDAVDNEGFDYTFRHYSSFKDIEDSEFQILRKAYVDAGDALEKYLTIDV